MRRMKGPATRIKSKKYIMLSPGANIVVIFQLSVGSWHGLIMQYQV